MDIQQELILWFRKMGYDGEIPESLGNICNKSTLFIWEELMHNGKPKQEVDNMRNNIIIQRLKSKPLNKQDQFSFPVKEINVYMKKQQLETKLNNVKICISDKQNRLYKLSQNNKMKYITIEKLKSAIKENEEREYLLNKKCATLVKDIQETEEMLTFAKNLTPVELDENPNQKEITETLQKCAEKLETLLQEIPSLNNPNNTFQKPFRSFHSVQKKPTIETTFEKYLIKSERKHSEKITVLKHGGCSILNNRNGKRNFGMNKENIEPTKVSKNLFCEPTEKRKTENKRESLGILPESCLSDNNINFLMSSKKEQDIFSPNLHRLEEMNFGPLSTRIVKESLETSLNIFYESHAQISPQNSLDELIKDEFVSKSLRNLLYKHNRQIIFNIFQTLSDNLKLDVTRNIVLECGKNQKRVNQEDIAKLQLIHIQTELQTLKLKAVLKDLTGKINKKKKCIYSTLSSKGNSQERIEDICKLFEQQVDDVGLDAVLREMKKEINQVKRPEESSELQITLGKITQTKEDILQKISSIKNYISNICKILQSTIHTKESTIACVRRLGPFVEDLSWSLPLTENLCSNETSTFEKFPLEYNRKCIYTDSRIYYRDIADNIPSDIELDSESLYMLTEILSTPFSPPEIVVLNILKNKMKLDALKSLQTFSRNLTYEKYSLKELQTQESYIQYALDKLNSILYSSSSSKTLATADNMQKIMNIWLEMPLKDFISPNRTLEGKEYKYYEKQFDNFYNNF